MAIYYKCFKYLNANTIALEMDGVFYPFAIPDMTEVSRFLFSLIEKDLARRRSGTKLTSWGALPRPPYPEDVELILMVGYKD